MSTRQTQHRANNEERAKNKLMAELKRENQQLRRKVGRLQKQLARATERALETEPPEPEVQPEVTVTVAPKDSCPNCASTVSISYLGPFVLRICDSCTWRKRESNGVPASDE